MIEKRPTPAEFDLAEEIEAYLRDTPPNLRPSVAGVIATEVAKYRYGLFNRDDLKASGEPIVIGSRLRRLGVQTNHVFEVRGFIEGNVVLRYRRDGWRYVCEPEETIEQAYEVLP